MSKKALTFIIIVIIILVTISFLKSNKEMLTDKKEYHELMHFNPAKIEKIIISDKENKVILKKATSKLWVVNSLFDYPASLSKISSKLLELAMLSSNQLVTTNSDNYEYLGLTKEKSSITLILDNNIKSGIDIGLERKGNLKSQGETGRYVKTFNNDEVYLVKDDLYLETKNKDWLDKRILNLKKNEVSKITLLKTNPMLIIEQLMDEKPNPDDEPAFILKGLNEGDTEKTYETSRIVSGLVELQLDSIYPQEHEDMKKLQFVQLLQITMNNKAKYNCFAAEEKEQFYLKIELNTDNLSKKESEIELAKKLSSWVYLIQSFDASIFKKKYIDLVEVMQKDNKNNNQKPQTDEVTEEHPLPNANPVLSEQSETTPSL